MTGAGGVDRRTGRTVGDPRGEVFSGVRGGPQRRWDHRVRRDDGVVPERLVAVRYWSSYPDEIEAWISETEAIEAEVLVAWERQQDLLAP